MDDVIRLAYQKSISLLKQNTTKHGFQAAPVNHQKPDYSMLFGRDSSICALAVLDHSDPELVATAETSLESLRQVRSALGQVPFRVDMVSGYRDFWYPGNVDSTLWWVLAALRLVQVYPDKAARWQTDIEHSLTWLRYQDVAEVGLVMQGQRSDWADEMPNHGAVLYSNALWYKVVQEYVTIYGSSSLVNGNYAQKVHQAFNRAFWPYDDSPTESSQKLLTNKAFERAITWAKTDLVQQPYYISYLSRRSFGWRCDMFANVLSMLFGLSSSSQQEDIERYLWSVGMSQPYPGKALYPVVYPGDSEWQEGMAARNQDIPHQYHNGGIWPFIGSFWVLYLAAMGKKHGAAESELLKLAQANALNDWEFNEYLHGELGNPMGVPHQSWNAATYIMAYQAVVEKKLFWSSTPQAQKTQQAPPDSSLHLPAV